MAAGYSASLAPTAVTFLQAGEAETVAFDVGTGARRGLLVQVTWQDQSNDITGVTYNGVAMTSLCSKIANGPCAARFYGLANPTSGTNNIVVTMGAGNVDSRALISAWVGDGVDQTTPFDTAVTNNGSGSSTNIVSSATLTTGALGDRAVFFHATYNGNNTITATPTNYTERQDAATGDGWSTEFGDAAGAASITGSATWSNGAFLVNWVTLAVNVNASPNTYTVKPSGGDYTSLSAWEAARQSDLTGTGPAIVECSGNLSDTTAVTVDGWTTTAADYIQIITPQVDRHAGVWDATKYRLEVSLTFSRVLQIYENHVRVEGLQVRQTSASADAWASVFVGSIDGPTLIDACLVRCASTSASQGHGIHVLDNTTSSAVTTIRNTIVYGIAAGAGVYMSNGTADPVTNIDNCTLIGATYGIHRVFATVTVRNTYAHGATNAYTGTMTLSSCAHSSATVFTGSTASIAHSTANFTNVTGGSENYHLVAGASTVLRHNGENLSSSFTKDIDGQTRDHWSIGADEPFAANTVIRYVNTGSSSGGDGTTNATSGANRAYVSLSAALAAQVTARTGLVANDEVLEIHCCGSAADATGVTVQTFVTDATRYVHIRGNPSDPNGRHAGVWSTSKYRIELAVDSSAVLLNAVPWTRVTGIQMRNSHVDSWYAFRDNNPTGSTSVYLDSCIMRCLSNSYAVFNPGASGTNALHCRNCIVTEGRDGFVSDGGADMLVLENCVAVGLTGDGIIGNGVKATNCYCGGNALEDYDTGTIFSSLTNCYSEDGTRSTPTAAYSTSAGAYFRNVTAGSEDLHIGALSSLRGAGSDLSGSFTHDIDNETRSAPWDVGVDQYLSPGNPWHAYAQQHPGGH